MSSVLQERGLSYFTTAVTSPAQFPNILQFYKFDIVVNVPGHTTIQGNDNRINGLNTNVDFTADSAGYTITIKNTYFEDVTFRNISTVPLTVLFDNCSFRNCTFVLANTNDTITLQQCIGDIIIVNAESGTPSFNIIDSKITNGFFNMAVNVTANTSPCTLTACVSSGIINATGSSSGQFKTFLTDVQCQSLALNGHVIATNVICASCTATGNLNSVNNIVIHGQNVFLSLSSCTSSAFSTVVMRNVSGTNNSALIQISNSNDIVINGLTISNGSSTARPLYNFNNCTRMQILGSGTAANITAGSATNTTATVVMVNPLTYVLNTYTASSAATSHTVSTGVLGPITHLFVQGRNIASEQYNGLTINSPSNGQFTITYSTPTSANLHYEVWSAVYP